MNKIKKSLKPIYHWLIRLSKWKRRIGLHCTDFTIISNNCTGGYVYQYFGVPYKTPTEGLYFTTEDYLKLVERPEHYFKHEVKLIDPKESSLAKTGKNIHYPVGVIDDVEVYFMHYPDPKEALEKWYRRSTRMNFSKIFFLLTETELMKNGDIELFADIMGKKDKGCGVCLTLKNYDYPFTQYVPNVPLDLENSNAAWKPEIIINSINWKSTLNKL